jgi:hypothetical protein
VKLAAVHAVFNLCVCFCFLRLLFQLNLIFLFVRCFCPRCLASAPPICAEVGALGTSRARRKVLLCSAVCSPSLWQSLSRCSARLTSSTKKAAVMCSLGAPKTGKKKYLDLACRFVEQKRRKESPRRRSNPRPHD